MFFLHGILGTGANWRSVARRFVAARPDWAAVLVDLPEHGGSVGKAEGASLKSAASALLALEPSIQLPVRGILGHSFGGKLALQWLKDHPSTDEAWIIDASPSPVPQGVDAAGTAGVLCALERVGDTGFPTRSAFVEAIVAQGQSRPMAQWLAMNLTQEADGWRFGPDLRRIRALIEDYARSDLWQVVEHPPPDCFLGFVLGGESTVVCAEDRKRLEALAEANPRLRVHDIAGAGHWVHVDAPDRLMSLLTSAPGPRP
jgi:pimeloyl-ACP methyl ester carboxylesterase